MSYFEAMAVSGAVCMKALFALLLVRKSAAVLSLRALGRSQSQRIVH